MSHGGGTPVLEAPKGAPNRMSPPPLALHPRLDFLRVQGSLELYRAPVFLFVFLHLSRPGGCKVGLGSGSRLFEVFESEPCLRPDGCKVWVWLEASSFLQMKPWLEAVKP